MTVQLLFKKLATCRKTGKMNITNLLRLFCFSLRDGRISDAYFSANQTELNFWSEQCYMIQA